MASSLTDINILSQDAAFIARVRSSMIQTCIAITTEDPNLTPFHRERATYAVAILNNPDAYKQLFANSVATNAAVGTDAGVGTGTVTSANVTDPHIASAISGQFNSFFRTPAS